MKKNTNRVYKKKHFFLFLYFLGENFILDCVINPKSQILHANFFFAKIHIRAKKQVCNQKRDLKLLPQICVFAYEKMHIIKFSEKYMISIFDQNLNHFLRVKMHSFNNFF